MLRDDKLARRRVLVVEDDAITRELLALVVRLGGYAATAIESALCAAAVAHEERPCAILLDLALPFRSGLSLLEELKGDPVTASIPVVIVSAMAELLPPDRRALADAVLGKPVDVGQLLETLDRLAPATRAV